MTPLLLAACAAPTPDPDPGIPSSPSSPSTPEEPRPNVLVLLTDDQGVDKVAAYGEHPRPPPTPNLDALARDGVLFRNAYAAPVCSPGRAALLTGRYGRRTGIGGVIQSRDHGELPLSEVTLPELLATADPPFANAAVGKWHLAAVNSADGLDHPNLQGFDRFSGTPANLYDALVDDGIRRGYYHWDLVTDGVPTIEDRYATTVQVDEALAQMASLPEPWLLYVAFNAPHEPLNPPPPELAPSFGPLDERDPKPRLYAAIVEALDTEIGRLLSDVDRERTTIFLLSDNGTPPHATIFPWDPQRAKDSPFEGGSNVPLIVAGAGVASPGRETEALVHVVDVFATIADLAGVDPGDIDGRSLLPILADPAASVSREVVHVEKFLPNGDPPWFADWRISRDRSFKWMEIEGREEVFDLRGRFDDGDPIDPASLPEEDRAEIEQLRIAHHAFWEGR